eukprot:1193426-Prorocentrum_minimum.AAC.2
MTSAHRLSCSLLHLLLQPFHLICTRSPSQAPGQYYELYCEPTKPLRHSGVIRSLFAPFKKLSSASGESNVSACFGPQAAHFLGLTV